MAERDFNIVVCAGHCKREKGAKNKEFQLHEWTCNRVISRWLVNVLKEKGYSLYPITDATLPQKVKMINDITPDLALDIHMSVLDETCTGHSCRYLNGSGRSRIFAECINEGMNHNQKLECVFVIDKIERGAYFLRKTNCPSVIIELGNIDYHHDIFSTFKSVENIAKSIEHGISVAIHSIVAEKTLNEAIALMGDLRHEV